MWTEDCGDLETRRGTLIFRLTIWNCMTLDYDCLRCFSWPWSVIHLHGATLLCTVLNYVCGDLLSLLSVMTSVSVNATGVLAWKIGTFTVTGAEVWIGPSAPSYFLWGGCPIDGLDGEALLLCKVRGQRLESKRRISAVSLVSCLCGYSKAHMLASPLKLPLHTLWLQGSSKL